MMEYIQPSIEVLGIRVDEPITTLTDLIVSFSCFLYFYRISKFNINSKISYFLRFYFLSMGFATAIGGLIGHGFLYLLSFAWKLPGWFTSMFSIALLERAAIEYARPHIKPSTGKFFARLNIIELSIFVIITFSTLNFFFVEVHSAYGLLIVVSGFNFFIYRKTKSKGSKLFLIAVGFSAVSALVFMNKWGLCPWFNHFDISHCFMAMSAFYFYKGAKQILLNEQK